MRLLVSALEPSANLHLETVLKDAHNITMRGIFEPSLGSPDISSNHFSVMGFVDALKKIWFAKKAIKLMVSLSKDCDEALLIDAPAFNVPLAKALKKNNPNFKITYYILPKVWAWKKGRIKTVNRFTDVQAYIFPFEKQYWQNGIFVGNPLLKQIKNFKQEVVLQSSVAFLPGSRASEIKALMPVFKEAAASIKEKKLLIIPKHFSDKQIKALYGDISMFEICKDAKEGLYAADKAVVCSGTATLEAALIGTPFVLVYKAKKIDALIAKMFVKLKHVGLANILFDFEDKEPMHTELLQDDVTANTILNELAKLNPHLFLQKSCELRSILQTKQDNLVLAK